MRFTPDMVAAFGDWLELDRIRRGLLAARPELAHSVEVDTVRPLLRIARATGGEVLVAKTEEPSQAQWVVGVPGVPDPLLHDTGSLDEVVRTVLQTLEC
jgi:hypothetical protein